MYHSLSLEVFIKKYVEKSTSNSLLAPHRSRSILFGGGIIFRTRSYLLRIKRLSTRIQKESFWSTGFTGAAKAPRHRRPLATLSLFSAAFLPAQVSWIHGARRPTQWRHSADASCNFLKGESRLVAWWFAGLWCFWLIHRDNWNLRRALARQSSSRCVKLLIIFSALFPPSQTASSTLRCGLSKRDSVNTRQSWRRMSFQKINRNGVRKFATSFSPTWYFCPYFNFSTTRIVCKNIYPSKAYISIIKVLMQKTCN